MTLEVPELVKVIACEPPVPTRTPPKLKLEGLAVSCPCTPVPLKLMDVGDPGALLLIATLPLALLAEAGAN